MTTPAPDISSLLDQLREQWVEVVKEREGLRKVLSMLVCNSCHNRIGWNETPTKYGDWTKCTSCRAARAVLNDRKGPSA